MSRASWCREPTPPPGATTPSPARSACSRARRCVGPSAFGRFVLLPARLNGSEYYFLKVAEVLPCLDLARAEVVPFRTSPERIKDITKYAFHKPMIPDPLVFPIPELPGLFATPAVAEAIERGRVPGFQFTPLG